MKAIVRFGTVFIITILVTFAFSGSAFPANEKNDAESGLSLQEVRKRVEEYVELGIRTARVDKKHDELISEMVGLKQKSKKSEYRLGQFLARREIREIAPEFHEILEEKRRIHEERKEIFSVLAENTEKAMKAVTSARRKIENNLKKIPEETSLEDKRNMIREEARLLSLKRLADLIEMKNKYPDIFSEEDLPEEEFQAPAPELNDMQHRYMHRGTRRGCIQNPGMRLVREIEEMNRQQRFLENQMKRMDKTLERREKIIRRIQENRPEFFDEIREEESESK